MRHPPTAALSSTKIALKLGQTYMEAQARSSNCVGKSSKGRAMTSNEQLLSAREAAILLGANPRTAQLRAKRALVAGDPTVRMIAGAYCSSLAWWQKTLAQPIKPGRPSTTNRKG
jgi:hypothetical protein